MPRKSRASRRNKRGGSYSSASSYGVYVNGGQNAQYDRTLGTSGPYSNVQGNVIIGAQGQNIQSQAIPTSENLSLIQSAGKRRCNSKRSRRGGFLGSIINQAVVPFSILGMQQTYRRKRHGGKKTRRNR